MSAPSWAQAPGPDWSHRGNFSDSDVVWYHEPTDRRLYQLGPDHYVEPGQPVTASVPDGKIKRNRFWWWRSATAGMVGGVAASVAAHFVRF